MKIQGSIPSMCCSTRHTARNRDSALSIAAAVVVAALLLACGASSGLTTPEPSRTPVQPADLLGTWQQQRAEYTVTIEFTADGRFRQIVTLPGTNVPQTQTGNWNLSGSTVQLDTVLMCDIGNNWRTRNVDWFMADLPASGQRYLYGGLLGDPDYWNGFTRIQSAATSGAAADTNNSRRDIPAAMTAALPAADSSSLYFMDNDGFICTYHVFAADGRYVRIEHADIPPPRVTVQGTWSRLDDGGMAVNSEADFSMTLSSGNVYLVFDRTTYPHLAQMRSALRNWLERNTETDIPVAQLGQFTLTAAAGERPRWEIRLASSAFASPSGVIDTSSVSRADLAGMVQEIDRYLASPYAGMQWYRRGTYRGVTYLYEDRGLARDDAVRAALRTNGLRPSYVIIKITPDEYASSLRVSQP